MSTRLDNIEAAKTRKFDERVAVKVRILRTGEVQKPPKDSNSPPYFWVAAADSSDWVRLKVHDIAARERMDQSGDGGCLLIINAVNKGTYFTVTRKTE